MRLRRALAAVLVLLAPQIQPVLASLTIFQRTPGWIVPRGDREVGDFERTLYRAVPGLVRLARAAIYGVDCGWLRQLVPRHPRPQHHAVADVQLAVRRATRRFQPAEYLIPRKRHPAGGGLTAPYHGRGDDGAVRLFVAVTPPGEVVEALRIATAGLRELAPDLRWTRPEQWHVTLVFLGEVGDDVARGLARRLSRAAARHPPLSLGGGGRFGHRVLWTGVQGDRDGLCRLADSAGAAARRSRLPLERRPYHPHLTLARADGGADLRSLVERLAPWQGLPWVVRRLHLVRSRLGAGPDGSALHEPIAGWPLEG